MGEFIAGTLGYLTDSRRQKASEAQQSMELRTFLLRLT